MSPRGRRAAPRRSDAVELELFPSAEPVAAPSRVDEPRFSPYDHVPGATPDAAIRIATLTRTAKDVLEGAFFPLWVRGEVSDFKAHRNGHWYFCLRDETSQMRCVIWSRDALRIDRPPEDGEQVVAYGRLTVYQARGDMQLAITEVAAVGDGLWRTQFEVTRARLAADGLFALERKRPIPSFPERVAVVTSPDGAALRDIAAVMRRRCPTAELVVVPAKVQGEGAAAEIAAAVERVGRWGGAQTLIVGRGGGASEDLWAFNDERVARAVAACPIPTISAVGHEVDVTLCDLVADLRAPTPSAAAEAAVPVLSDLAAELEAIGSALAGAFARRTARARLDVERVARDLARAGDRAVDRRREVLRTHAARLDALSPLAVLGRGYAVAQDADGRTLTSADAFAPAMPFRLRLCDGAVIASVDEVEHGSPAADSAR